MVVFHHARKLPATVQYIMNYCTISTLVLSSGSSQVSILQTEKLEEPGDEATFHPSIKTNHYATLFSLQVDSAWLRGDHENARRLSRSAKMWSLSAIIVGVVVYVIAVVAGAVSGALNSCYDC